MTTYEGRMGAPAPDPETSPAQRQDSVQHAVPVDDPDALRRAFLLYGTSGQAARIDKASSGA